MDEQQAPDKTTFTAEEYRSGTAPYEYLNKLRTENPIKHIQEKERLDGEAKALGVKNFKSLYKAYLETVVKKPNVTQQEAVTEFSGQEMELKCGSYSCTDDFGVTMFSPQYGEVTICPHAIMPVRRIVNIDTGECKTELAFRRGTLWRKAIFDKSVLASAQKIVSLASQGIAVDSENARQLVTFLSYMENQNYLTLKEMKSVGHLGWTSYGFAPYVDNLLFDGNEQYRQAFQAVQKRGSFDAWKEEIKKVRSGPSIAARIMLAASFASVLVSPLHALPFMVHGWSNVSGIGKTVCLMACGSVWANPAQGEYIKNFNTTNVGIEMMAGFYGSMPLCLDELQLKSGKREAFDDMIYQFCEGVGRTRGSKNGGLQRVPTWRNCAISTGEEPLTNAASKAGAINRVLDINCGDVKMFDDPRESVRVFMQNYGHAGPAFVESLTESNLEAIRAMVEGFQMQLENQATEKQTLAASLILAADAWAEQVIFDGDGKALKANDILPFLQSTAATDVNKRCYDWLCDTIAANPSRFIPRDDGAFVGERWGDLDDINNRAYIIKSIFERVLSDEGYNSAGFLNWARNHGLIETDADGKHFAKQRRLKGVGLARCISLRLSADVSGMEIVQEEVEW